MKYLGNHFTEVHRSNDPENLYLYSPGILVLPSGRIVVTLDRSGGKGSKIIDPADINPRGMIFISDDQGETWEQTGSFSYVHARPFLAGEKIYIIGHSGDLMIKYSADGGATWSEDIALTSNEKWHQAPCNYIYKDDFIYLVMEKRVYFSLSCWPVSELAPVLMRGKVTDDLTKAENWTFADEVTMKDVVDYDEIDYFGVPFYHTHLDRQMLYAPRRNCAPMGWLETNIVHIKDKNHYFYDKNNKTLHLWMRAHTGGTGYAAVMKVVEQEDGTMRTMCETVPSGKKVVFVPCPGGQMKFHILYDEATKLYWLLSSQSTDSMTRAEVLPKDRYNLPNNERQRLQLHFSRNMIDWCFACMAAKGNTQKEARHYASMAIAGNDIYIASRSGDKDSLDAHNGNIISFHKIKNFRELVY